MLIKCPECDLPISDHAVYCPHCGYPLQPSKLAKTYSSTKNKRRMRLPNGFGQITEIKGRNLRNPFRVMVPVGKNEEGRPISKLLKPKAYFRTYNEAYAALTEYNKDPYDLTKTTTMEELYEMWLPKYSEDMSASAVGNVKSTWKYCSSIYKMPVTEVRVKHMKYCIEHGTKTKDGVEIPVPVTFKPHIKFIFNKLFDYAVECNLVDKNYARMFSSSSETREVQKPHMTFTNEEMKILWNNMNNRYIDYVLIQCYMGWRPAELIGIRTDEVNLKQNIIISGLKTEAGISRHVPIHPLVKPFIERYYKAAKDTNAEYLFHNPKVSIAADYNTYRKYFSIMMADLKIDPNHRPHDGRKQFVTMAKKAGVNEWAIKRIVGHKITDITEGTYTDRDDAWLYNEICKIQMYN